MKRLNPTIALLLWLTMAYAAGEVGALGCRHGVESLYPALVKPAWALPPPFYGPVGTVLDALLGIAAWRVARTEGPKGAAFAFWGTALALTALWPWLFFGFGKLALALGASAALLIVLGAAVPAFGRRDRLAALLLVPVVLWAAYTTTLGFAMRRLDGKTGQKSFNAHGAAGVFSGGPALFRDPTS